MAACRVWRHHLATHGEPVRVELSSQRLRDVVVALWVLGWIGLGIAIGVNVNNLTALSHTVSRDGQAVAQIGGTLRALHALPLIGGAVGSVAGTVQQAGLNAAASGASSASSVHTLAVLLAVAVGLLPSIPVLAFYLPARQRRVREARVLRDLLRRHAGEPELERYLARRAVLTLDLESLSEAGAPPFADPRGDSQAALAAAELRRVGLDPRLLRPARLR